MGVYRSYCCPDCDGTFRFFHHPSDDPPPNYCPLCGAYVGMDAPPVFVPQAPAIKTVKSKSGDQVAQAVMDASEYRREQAAEILGVDKVELSGMNVTDLADNLRPGDQAAVGIKSNPVSDMMAAAPGQTGFQTNTTAQGFAAATTQGPHAYAGDRTRIAVGERHSAMAAQMIAAGRVGRGAK